MTSCSPLWKVPKEICASELDSQERSDAKIQWTTISSEARWAYQRSSNNAQYTVALPPQPSWQLSQWWAKNVLPLRETLIKALSDCTLEFLYIARNNPTLTSSYLRKVMMKSCIKIPVKSDSAIEPAFFLHYPRGEGWRYGNSII